MLNIRFFFSAPLCPPGEPLVVVEEGNIQLDLDVPENDEINPDDVVTSEGITLNPGDELRISSPDDNTFRVMDVSITSVGASTVTVTFTRPDEPEVVIEV